MTADLPNLLTITTTGVHFHDQTLSSQGRAALLERLESDYAAPAGAPLLTRICHGLYESLIADDPLHLEARAALEQGYTAVRFAYGWDHQHGLLLAEVACRTGNTWRDFDAHPLSDDALAVTEQEVLIECGLPLPPAPPLLAHAADERFAERSVKTPAGLSQVVVVPAHFVPTRTSPTRHLVLLPRLHHLWLEVKLPASVVRDQRRLDPRLRGHMGLWSELYVLDADTRARFALISTNLGLTVPPNADHLLIQSIVMEQANSDPAQPRDRAFPLGELLGQAITFWDFHGQQVGTTALLLHRGYQKAADVDRARRMYRIMLEDWQALHLALLDRLTREDHLAVLPTTRLPDGTPVTLFPEAPTDTRTTPEPLPLLEARLTRRLKALKGAYPGVWKGMLKTYAARKEKGAYFLTFEELLSLLPSAGSLDAAARLAQDAQALFVLGTWRMTRGVYRIDETVMDSLWNDTQPPERLPLEQFAYLPAWCVYVLLPGRQDAHGRPVSGVFCMLTPGQSPRVQLTFDHPDGNLSHYGIPLGTENLRDLIQEDTEQHWPGDLQGLNLRVPSAELDFLLNTLNVLTYLASFGADLQQRAAPRPPRKPAQQRGPAPAEANTVWDVGVRLGAALRSAREARATSTPTPGEKPTFTSPQPHVRAAHFHRFRLGSRDIPLEDRPIRIRWLPPIPVNFDFGDDDLPITVRPVRA